MKHKIKDRIEKSSIPFGIKIKPLYNKISKEMELICPEYNSIKSQISRNLNKKLPSNVTTFAEIPSESEYYKTKRAKLFREYNDDIFVDNYNLVDYIYMDTWNHANRTNQILTLATVKIDTELIERAPHVLFLEIK
ncbi:hypothetical protein H8356DRAFT_1427120 [Neocallimastix lanati (nom. inval.)]|nr:hypothetical protein H8356DRAFT_1427120 [Neocallimastix sp. JGI-2020a]